MKFTIDKSAHYAGFPYCDVSYKNYFKSLCCHAWSVICFVSH